MNSHNTAVVANNSVTLHCTSNASNHAIQWYNSSCSITSAGCLTNETLYLNTTTRSPPPRFTVIASIIAGQYVSNITISPTALNDAEIYSCVDTTSAYGQLLIVLGKISCFSIVSLGRPY